MRIVLPSMIALTLLLALPDPSLARDAVRHRARLVRVVDGDTLRLDIDLGADVTLRNQAVRILGIDAPELHGPERAAGLKSKAALAGFLSGKRLTVKLQDKDKYGRWLADVFAGAEQENVALWMIRQRLARVYQIGRRGATLPAGALPWPQPTKNTPGRPGTAL